MEKITAAAGVVCVALLVSGCSSKPDGCVTAPGDLAGKIVEGSTSPDLAIKKNTGRAIKSPVSDVYFVAYRIRIDGNEEAAVWAVAPSLNAPAGVQSVDGYAQQFTDWPAMDNASGAQLARDARSCLD